MTKYRTVYVKPRAYQHDNGEVTNYRGGWFYIPVDENGDRAGAMVGPFDLQSDVLHYAQTIAAHSRGA